MPLVHLRCLRDASALKMFLQQRFPDKAANNSADERSNQQHEKQPGWRKACHRIDVILPEICARCKVLRPLEE